MKIYGSLSKSTKSGGKVIWNFCEVHGKFFALRENNKVVPVKDLDGLRSIYKTYRDKYGMTPVTV